ncbi:unnamed protein product [Calypogeia fissa]
MSRRNGFHQSYTTSPFRRRWIFSSGMKLETIASGVTNFALYQEAISIADEAPYWLLAMVFTGNMGDRREDWRFSISTIDSSCEHHLLRGHVGKEGSEVRHFD